MRRIGLIALAVALLASPAAFAKPVKKGVYIGGSVGQSYTDINSVTPINIDDEDFAYKLYAGYRAASFFAVEGGYRDLGEIKDEMGGGTFRAETTAWDAEGLGIIKLGIVDIFGKVGVIFSDSDTLLGSESDTNAIYGLGVGVRFGGLGIRLEYELIDAKSSSGVDGLEMLSLGVSYTF